MIFQRFRAAERDVFAGSPRGAARGAGATSSAPVTVACSRTAATTSAMVVRVWSSMFVETCTAVESWRPSARTSSSARRRCAIALAVSIGASISTLNATSGGPRGDEGGAGRRVQALRPEVGAEVLQAAGPAQLRAGPPARQLAVEVHGDAELPELVGEHERLGARRALVGRVEVDDRRDVDRSHPRVQAAMVREVDVLDRHARAREHLRVQLARPADRA